MNYFEDLIWLFNSNTSSRGIVRLNIAEGALLYKYCKKKKNGTLLEIGRKFGGSTVIMASALSTGKLYSIDVVRHTEAEKNTESLSGKIVFIDGNSSKCKWEKKIDLLFIDGDHSYEGVKSDVKHFCPWVELGGYVVFHDVIGKKSTLTSIWQKLLKTGYERVAVADSMLVLRKTE